MQDESQHHRKLRSRKIKDTNGVYQEVNADKFLAHIDVAKREILAADSLVKVKALWNRADAMRQLGQASKDPELINLAMEFKMRCERRLGEMVSAMKEAGEITHAHKRRKNSYSGARITKLKDLHISAKVSMRAQKLASVPEAKFEAALASAREGPNEITRASILKQFAPAGEEIIKEKSGETTKQSNIISPQSRNCFREIEARLRETIFHLGAEEQDWLFRAIREMVGNVAREVAKTK